MAILVNDTDLVPANDRGILKKEHHANGLADASTTSGNCLQDEEYAAPHEQLKSFPAPFDTPSQELSQAVPANYFATTANPPSTFYEQAALALRRPLHATLDRGHQSEFSRRCSLDGTVLPSHPFLTTELRENRPIRAGARPPGAPSPTPFHDHTKECAGLTNAVLDTTSCKKHVDDRGELLARETDHRARNLLTLVQAIVRLTEAETVRDLKIAIAGRINALAIAHTLLAKSRWLSAELRELVEEELAPYRGNQEPHIQIIGPRFLLDPMGAQSIAMTLHELTTNAAKYGALSVPSGSIRLEWACAEHARLAVRWSETGGPRVKPPKRQGLGTMMIERTVRDQLNGTVAFDWCAEGLVCEIAIPTDKLVRI